MLMIPSLAAVQVQKTAEANAAQLLCRLADLAWLKCSPRDGWPSPRHLLVKTPKVPDLWIAAATPTLGCRQLSRFHYQIGSGTRLDSTEPHFCCWWLAHLRAPTCKATAEWALETSHRHASRTGCFLNTKAYHPQQSSNNQLSLGAREQPLTSRMAALAGRLGRSQKMRRAKRRSTASSRSMGRLLAPSTTMRWLPWAVLSPSQFCMNSFLISRIASCSATISKLTQLRLDPSPGGSARTLRASPCLEQIKMNWLASVVQATRI